MTDDYETKLRALLQEYAERSARVSPAEKTPKDHADRRMCGERLHAVVRPVLDALLVVLKDAGHDAAVREHIERDDAYPASPFPLLLAAASPRHSFFATIRVTASLRSARSSKLPGKAGRLPARATGSAPSG